MRRRAVRRIVASAGCLAACCTVALTVAVVPGATGTASAAATSTPAFTQTEAVTRTEEASTGRTTVVATNTVTLNVAQTTDLQGRQEIAVSWSGAHPTGGIQADQNSVTAQYEEYPMVLLECRDTPTHGDQPTPETCWTQAATERFQEANASDVSGTYPPYRLDQYSTTHGAVVGEPSTLPTTAECQYTLPTHGGTPVQYWLPWLAASGTAASGSKAKVYPGGSRGACGEPPQATIGITSALPSNETFGVTGLDGTGSAEFDVFTATENTTLGCSDTVACSLVAVPIMGISCDAAALPASPTTAELADLGVCEETGAYKAGAGGSHGTTAGVDDTDDLTVSGALWWSPSNWRNRITAPLTFDPSPAACSVTSSNPTVSVYGSELMLQATGQWEPYICGNKSYAFVQDALGEPQARNLVATGTADAAFTSYAQPGGYGKAVVNAPVAVTGFTISYDIDRTKIITVDGTKKTTNAPITTLKLTPLLLAKLLTQSYQGDKGFADPALATNPANITVTPEFETLNPTVTPNPDGNGDWESESELMSISSQSDVIEALTTYINDTPAARAFLNGTPDTSTGGYMVVNPAYKGIALPVDRWPLLDTYESTAFDHSADEASCLGTSPEPFYSLLDAPLATLEDVSEDMQFAKPNSTLTCSSTAGGQVNSMVAGGRQEAGHQFLIGITPLADDERYGLSTAALQTTPGTFVAPSNASLQAATSLLTPDATTGTWPIPYGAFQTPAGASAYPGTMVVYAAVPTTGLSATDAADYASLLQFAVSTGQTPGTAVGQLPPGYLPLTAADGLGALAAYTVAAAADVAAQNGKVPPLTPTSASTGTSAGTSTTATSTGTSTTTTSTTTTSPTSSSTSPGTSLFTNPSGERGYTPLTPLSPLSSLAAASSPAGNAAAVHHRPSVATPGILRLSRLASAALWTGNLPLTLVLLLALLGIVCVPSAYLAGRKRGRW